MKLIKNIARDYPYISVFILVEVLTMVFSGNARSMHYAPLFYACDVLYFYLLAVFVLPKNIIGFKGRLIKASMIIGLVILLAAARLSIIAATAKGSDGITIFTSRTAIVTMLYRAVLLLGYAGAYWMEKDQNRKANRLKHQVLEMENKRVMLENTNLLVQINQHTQLNAHNKLYSLVMPYSERAAKLVLVLSEQEQFSLQDIDEHGKIPLSREIECLENMIQLERLSAEHPLYIDLRIEGTNDADHLRIPPKLLVPLLENVFKHGIIDKAESPALVFLSVEGDQLTIETHNNKLPERDLPSYNIGLGNVRNRLLNFYPDAHEIKIIETEETFHLKLKITL